LQGWWGRWGRGAGDERLLTGGAWVPPVDIYENGNKVEVAA